MKVLLFFVIIATAGAAPQALTDASGAVLSIGAAGVSAASGFSVVAINAAVVPDGGQLYDAYGRARYGVVSGALTPLGTPRWIADAATKADHQRALYLRIDNLHTQIISLERWQTLYSVTIRDRSVEMTALTSQRDSLVTILQGP